MPKIIITEPHQDHQTKLTPAQEKEYQAWLDVTGMQPGSAYDTRGLWLAKRTGDPTVAIINPHDLPDQWKTPGHPTFSDQSKYAKPGQAPKWYGDALVAPNGSVVASRVPPHLNWNTLPPAVHDNIPIILPIEQSQPPTIPSDNELDLLDRTRRKAQINAAVATPAPWPPPAWATEHTDTSYGSPSADMGAQ